MRDISHKVSTARAARAKATLRVSRHLMQTIQDNKVPKGDPLYAAKLAAMMAAKNTSQIIPHCHPLPIEYVGVDYVLSADKIEIITEVKTTFKTGVEMEALTAASVAALTIYDMLKMFDEQMEIESIVLLKKTGGKSDYRSRLKKSFVAAVLVFSDSVAAGEKEDKSGRLIIERLEEEGLTVPIYEVLPDDKAGIVSTLKRICDQNLAQLIVTTGGTGLSKRDNSPEALAEVIERDVPGITETIRQYGQARNAFAMLSRARAGTRKNTLIISLPGSQGGVKDGLNAVFPQVLHSLEIIAEPGLVHADLS